MTGMWTVKEKLFTTLVSDDKESFIQRGYYSGFFFLIPLIYLTLKTFYIVVQLINSGVLQDERETGFSFENKKEK